MFTPYKEKHREIIISKLGKYVPIDTPMWVLSFQNYQKAETHRVLKRIKCLSIQTLLATNTKRPQIIQEIAVSSFTCLRVLQLGVNNIESIDFLNNLDAPQLTHLYLDHNIITDLRSIRRTDFPLLFLLSIYQNKVSNIQALPMANFPLMKFFSLKGNWNVNSIHPFIKSQFNLEYFNVEGTSVMRHQKTLLFSQYQKKVNREVILKI